EPLQVKVETVVSRNETGEGVDARLRRDDAAGRAGGELNCCDGHTRHGSARAVGDDPSDLATPDLTVGGRGKTKESRAQDREQESSHAASQLNVQMSRVDIQIDLNRLILASGRWPVASGR